ncbi:MAG TPA: TetR/AcrR family transcriptional regulator [Stackebrandtia sp.]|uniref:TetR/AcrR family transcriptional regulator n=1 Tax=Stackebrandtia sp. TaxID=2023065 RepID=UPI002D3B9CE5|nr:TetR/AcrR family transcriptional regulator [Stackebrandtia sp.]HZE39537.1 TetR/AcrR family transcriptional regulator [Stackebrandtia sp.]
MSHDLGRRERKKRDTRRAIQAAALRLALADGVESVTIASITEAADVARGTFFNYFDGKSAVFIPDPPWTPGELRAKVEARPASESPLECARAVLTEALDDLEADRDLADLWPRFFRRYPGMTPAHRPELEHALAAAIARRCRLRPDDMYPVVFTHVVMASFYSARTLAATRGQPIADVLGEALALVADGLVPPQS